MKYLRQIAENTTDNNILEELYLIKDSFIDRCIALNNNTNDRLLAQLVDRYFPVCSNDVPEDSPLWALSLVAYKLPQEKRRQILDYVVTILVSLAFELDDINDLQYLYNKLIYAIYCLFDNDEGYYVIKNTAKKSLISLIRHIEERTNSSNLTQ